MPVSTSDASPVQAEGLRIQLLGGFQVSVGNRLIQETEWTLSNTKSLVKLLALAPGHRLSKENIIEQLWPENDDVSETDDAAETKKAQRFYRTLLETRRTLEPNLPRGAQSAYLPLQRNGFLRLTTPGLLWVDVDAFETAYALARGGRELIVYDAALKLYQGDLLPEDLNAEWVVGPRYRLKQVYLELLEELAQLHLAQQEIPLAIRVLVRLVVSEPMYERAQRDLMRLYAMSGDRYQAIRHYLLLREACKKYELPLEAETERLYKDIRAGRLPSEHQVHLENEGSALAIVSSTRPPTNPAQPGEAHHTNLPLRTSSFIGRRQEIEDIKRMLPTTRLLTLTGAGGSGKSRLAEQVVVEVLNDYQDGVWLVELAALANPQLVLQTVATALRIQKQPEKTTMETLVDVLQRQHLLLVLDNCEHLLPACSDVVRSLLPRCPRLRILATSRERLRLSEEKVWPVPPLAHPSLDPPPPFEQLPDYDAIQLFIERARASKPAFTLTPQNAYDVVSLCHRLDGIPLALELAAAYMRVATVEQIAARLDDRLTLLEAKTQGELTRHLTLRAVIGWSHHLLSVPEQVVFRRLSVFRGGWTLDAAEAVCAGEPVQKDRILGLLAELAEKSLVTVEYPQEQVRYRFLEIIRQYSKERLSASPEAGEMAARHLEWFTEQAEQVEPELRRQHQKKWFNWLEREHDNLRAALRYALESGATELGLRLAGVLWRFWHARGHLVEALGWLERFLAKSQNEPAIAPQIRAKALEGAGWLIYLLGGNQQAIPQAIIWQKQALALSQEVGDKRGMAASLNALGMIAHYQGHDGHYKQALDLFNQALALNREANYPHGIADTLNNLGELAKDQEQYEQAFSLLNDALASFRVLGDERRITGMLINLSDLAYTRGHYQQVAEFGEEALTRVRPSGDDISMVSAVLNLGIGLLYQGDYERALPLLEEALALCRKLGDRWNTASCSIALGMCAYYQGTPGRASTFAQEALVLYRELTYSPGIAEAYLLVGKIRQGEGDMHQALVAYREGAALYRVADDKRGLATALEALASLATLQGEPVLALHLFGAAEALREKTGVMMPPCELPAYKQCLADVRASFDDQTWKQHWAAGKALLLDQIITEALASAEKHISSSGAPERSSNEEARRGSPSPRELQVIALIEQGKKDQEIADALKCEIRTVHTHVRNILSKLHLKNRAEVVVWAKEHHVPTAPFDLSTLS
jgi:predicted ATPase/DNA-binding SARP family transcriptional activator/DNA-binding CsgD family transcriptional regulator